MTKRIALCCALPFALFSSAAAAQERPAEEPVPAPAAPAAPATPAAKAAAPSDAWSATIRSGMADEGSVTRAEMESVASLRRRVRIVLYGGAGGGHLLEVPVAYGSGNDDVGGTAPASGTCVVETAGLDHVTVLTLAPGAGMRLGLSNSVEFQSRLTFPFGFGGKENVRARCNGGDGTQSTSVSTFAPTLEGTVRWRPRTFYLGAGLRAAAAFFFESTSDLNLSGTSVSGYFQAVLEGGFVFGPEERFDIGLRALPGIGTKEHLAGVHGEVAIGYAIF
jgi:hypothetical protein